MRYNEHMQKDISWRTMEHSHTEKTSEWFWVLGIVAVSIAVASLLFGNVFFALLVVMGSITLGLLANKEPVEIEVALTPKGVLIGPEFYPYDMLISFWIIEESPEHNSPVLLLDSRKLFLPHIVVPLMPESVVPITEYLEQYLSKKELREPFGHTLFELIGY